MAAVHELSNLDGRRGDNAEMAIIELVGNPREMAIIELVMHLQHIN
jgi:hypothetical protein